MSNERIKIDAPLWDQNTFIGRFKHFLFVTDPRSCIVPDDKLYEAKALVEQYRIGKEPPGTTEDKILAAKKLYEGAFHPDTGDLQNLFGRMCFQVPGGMAVTGAMLTFYRTSTAVMFWQWVNQSFNALVNYTNRNAKSPLTTNQLGAAYLSATLSAGLVAVQFKGFLEKRAGSLMKRYVPFVAVAAANCVNIPLMRQNEILDGNDVYDENGNRLGQSRIAAVTGISQVVLSRIVMCAPGMTVLPLVMERLEKRPAFKRATWFHAPFQTAAVGCFLLFMVPFGCAIFPQRASLSTSFIKKYEPEEYEKMVKQTNGKVPETVYFNKGL
ncbi:sideroflexin-2 [Frankliniella occidentalis]|uniref:Sidoreflexin n=1 Tax=Frankliniella occidentalis TaxID=133901 RepID=A0A6J1TCK1_FRAOC|nr:sideroflexin-2 [Frankliniella occidentalis]